MDVPPPRDDALAQPTRARLFALLAERRHPVPTHELAERLGLHPNGVRQHLERLRAAGLVARDRPRRRVGRPRDEWSIAPGARPGGEAPSGYADLGPWLARAVVPSERQLREIEATGRQIGGELAPAAGAAAPAEAIGSILTAMGFAPEREDGGGTVEFRLGNCPYREAARENQALVCTLHRGITQGLLDTLAPASELVGFVARDPRQAGCRIAVAGLG